VQEAQELRTRFHQGLAEIDSSVMRLFALVSESVAAATESLLVGDGETARKVEAGDAAVDQLERDLERAAERQLLLQSPMAGDMRYLVTVLRIVPELERSGDLAVHVARRAMTNLGGRLTPAVRGLVEDMGRRCVLMWRDAAEAWAERDREVAARLDTMDDELDQLHVELTAELLGCEMVLDDALQAALVGRFYERLGDHAVHIAERICYCASGPRDAGDTFSQPRQG
jgi:phosphate transport system protein